MKQKTLNKPRIGIDFTGSDTPLTLFFEGVSLIASEIIDPFELVIFSTNKMAEEFNEHLKKKSRISSHIKYTFVIVESIISMDDNPLSSIRTKKDASLPLGINMIKEQNIDAFITTGNTGALIAACKLHLEMLSTITRPALLATLPSKKDPLVVIDVGANVTCTKDQLLQFAKLGIAYARTNNHKKPSIGMLNIGSEKQKGRKEVREAYLDLQQLIKNNPTAATFLGNVEGKEVFDGKVNIVVTDGFSGNIFLKTTEGFSAFIAEQLSNNKSSGKDHKELLKTLDSSEYSGALVAGVKGIVIKCHGKTTSHGIKNSIKNAYHLIEENLILKMEQTLTSI